MPERSLPSNPDLQRLIAGCFAVED